MDPEALANQQWESLDWRLVTTVRRMSNGASVGEMSAVFELHDDFHATYFEPDLNMMQRQPDCKTYRLQLLRVCSIRLFGRIGDASWLQRVASSKPRFTGCAG